MNFSLKGPMEPKISGEMLENLYFQIHFAILTCMFSSKLINNRSELFPDFLSERISESE